MSKFGVDKDKKFCFDEKDLSSFGTLNSLLDRLVRPEVHIFNSSWPTFRICSGTGLSLAILMSVILSKYIGLSLCLTMGVIVVALLTFGTLAMITKLIKGEEELIYYHHQIAIIGVTSVLLALLQQPILAYLDLVALGIGLVGACGRLGCLMAGCCHGLPHSCGVCYREEHVAVGLTPQFVGIRLFPVQAVESVWLFCIVSVGVVLIVNNSLPGEALTWYLVAYGWGRFHIEFLRGDPSRFYCLGFSEAQWLSLLSLCAIVGLAYSGTLPFHSWHVGAALWLGLVMIVVSLKRQFQQTSVHKILHPHHVKELAEVIEQVTDLTNEKTDFSDQYPNLENISVGCTSLGIQVSASNIKQDRGFIHCYTLSRSDGIMAEEIAKALALLICQLFHVVNSGEVVKGGRGVFHLLIRTPCRNHLS